MPNLGIRPEEADELVGAVLDAVDGLPGDLDHDGDVDGTT